MDKKRLRRRLNSLLVVCCVLNGYSQGYEIKLIFNNPVNEIKTLSYYQGMKQIIVDTARQYSSNIYIFKGDSALNQGMYLINIENGAYTEVLLAEDQYFEVYGDALLQINNIRIENAEETEKFLTYKKFMYEMSLIKTEFQNRKKAYHLNLDSVDFYESKIEQINKKIKNEWQRIIYENPNTLFSNTIKLFIQPEIPEFNLPEDQENEDSLKWFLSYQYYRMHFLDYVVFDDERLLRVPFFQDKVFTYITKIIVQQPDSIIKAIDIILGKASENQEVYRFFITNFLKSYELNNAYAGDEIFIHLVDQYYLQGKTPWVSFTEQKDLDEKAARKKNTMYGSRIELPLLYDRDGVQISINDIKADKVVLMFWSTDCGFCTKEISDLFNLLNIVDENSIAVITMSFDIDKVKWEKYVEGYTSKNMIHINVWNVKEEIDKNFDIKSLPKYIVLDKDMKIVLKTYNYSTLKKELIKKN